MLEGQQGCILANCVDIRSKDCRKCSSEYIKNPPGVNLYKYSHCETSPLQTFESSEGCLMDSRNLTRNRRRVYPSLLSAKSVDSATDFVQDQTPVHFRSSSDPFLHFQGNLSECYLKRPFPCTSEVVDTVGSHKSSEFYHSRLGRSDSDGLLLQQHQAYTCSPRSILDSYPSSCNLEAAISPLWLSKADMNTEKRILCELLEHTKLLSLQHESLNLGKERIPMLDIPPAPSEPSSAGSSGTLSCDLQLLPPSPSEQGMSSPWKDGETSPQLQLPNKLYKTELCRSWEETGDCRYSNKCQFAHGRDELRHILRHPKYKTEMCRTFIKDGTCPYGTRCRFIHNSPKVPHDSGEFSPLSEPSIPLSTNGVRRAIFPKCTAHRLRIFEDIVPGQHTA